MDSKPLQVTDLSLEELLKLAEEDTPKKEEFLDLNDVSAFISAFKIKPGECQVKKQLLYELYKQWSLDPVGVKRFGVEILKFLEMEKSFYLIDKNAYTIVTKIKEISKLKRNSNLRTSTKVKNHLDYFFTANGIKEGSFNFPSKILYALYRSWCIKNNFKIKFKYDKFVSIACSRFKQVRTYRGRFFRLDTSIFKYLTKEQLKSVNDGKEE